MAFNIMCAGISAEEGKELDAFLTDMEGVESVEVEYAGNDLEPWYLQAAPWRCICS